MAVPRMLGNNLLDIHLFMSTFYFPLAFIIGGLILFPVKGSLDCERFFEKPVFILLLLTVIVVLAGIISVRHRIAWLLWVYLILMAVLIVWMFFFSLSLWTISNHGAVASVGKVNTEDWNKTLSCLEDVKVCEIPDGTNVSLLQYNLKHSSTIQIGCCNSSASDSANLDDKTWSSPGGHCVHCQSCKAGILEESMKDWKKVALVNFICLTLMTIIYFTGCFYLYKNSKEESEDDTDP